jgi:hypothetical protein
MNWVNKKSALEKEWIQLEKQEKSYLEKRKVKQDSKMNLFLSEKVPTNLQNTLELAFSKAFAIVFEKGVGMIEKTYSKKDLLEEYDIKEYTMQVKKNRKSLRAFSKKAQSTKMGNIFLSGISGIGLGVLGIGLPDIALFLSLVLKNIYEISLNYGFDYQSEVEKKWILLMICTSVSYGDTLHEGNALCNAWIDDEIVLDLDMNEYISMAAKALSKELLYMKFLQGIPVVGAIGGMYDVMYMNTISSYAQLKYKRRFYSLQRKKAIE